MYMYMDMDNVNTYRYIILLYMYTVVSIDFYIVYIPLSLHVCTSACIKHIH